MTVTINASELPDVISFPVVFPDGRETTIPMTDPPDGSPPLPLSARREKLKELVDSCRGDPDCRDFVYVYDQVLRGMDEFLREHGDVVFE